MESWGSHHRYTASVPFTISGSQQSRLDHHFNTAMFLSLVRLSQINPIHAQHCPVAFPSSDIPMCRLPYPSSTQLPFYCGVFTIEQNLGARTCPNASRSSFLLQAPPMDASSARSIFLISLLGLGQTHSFDRLLHHCHLLHQFLALVRGEQGHSREFCHTDTPHPKDLDLVRPPVAPVYFILLVDSRRRRGGSQLLLLVRSVQCSSHSRVDVER